MTNLPHPGGNITRFHNFEPAIGGKWLAFLKQIAPIVRVAWSTFQRSYRMSRSSTWSKLQPFHWALLTAAAVRNGEISSACCRHSGRRAASSS